MSEFSDDIARLNGIYKLPVSSVPTLDVGVPVVERLKAFKDILMEECDEIDDIVAAAARGDDPLAILTMLADLLDDIQVYCASEMAKFGLPLDAVLTVYWRCAVYLVAHLTWTDRLSNLPIAESATLVLQCWK